MNYQKINNITGWVVFGIASFVYLKTMEATGSLWDCGEFASSAYKIQIPHPPGAPLFVLIGRLFMIPFDPQHAATGINTMSAMASAFTILFLFWSITHFARKIALNKNKELDNNSIFSIMAAGVIGALAYTFSDSFWFSAVEGEVYALSSFFTAIVFWAALKWEQNVTEEQAQGIKGHFTKADRWLILIFYLMGLSIGVHLLNLLTIPAIIVIYYFKRYKPTTGGTVLALLIGCIITGLVQKAVIQWSIKGAGKFDVWFVNSYHLPFSSGFAFFFVLLAVLIAGGIIVANRKNWNFLKLAMWSMAFMILGFSSYMTTLLRSNANPSIDMYNVDNPVSLVGYLSREQYGDWPLLYGNDFTEVPPQKEGSTYWTKGKNEYHDQGPMGGYDYGAADNAHLFPRMWDFNTDRNQHIVYRNFGKLEEGEDPSMMSNIRYFLTYQMGVMYTRYFMWNFAGRQNDVQGFGNSRDGNAISGITPIDNLLTGGQQTKMPDSISKDNKGQNKLYFLPLILGILGMIYQYKKEKKDFLINGLFFFFTGIAIVLYLNQAGMQPRERDYAYVGSFYAFAVWIGLGVMFVGDLINNYIKNGKLAQRLAALVCLFAVPVLMANQEWDDHDRSKKTIARDLAINYLESCPKNAILVSFGDNDTYPLWYAQEVEGIRTDVRVINYSLLASDWYFNQMRYKVNDSDPIDAIFSEEQVEGNNRAAVFVSQAKGYDAKSYYNLFDLLKNYTASEEQSKQLQSRGGDWISVIPSKKVFIPVNPADIAKDSTLRSEAPLYPQLNIDLKKDVVYKNDLAILSMIAANNWKRPICFTSNNDMEELGLGNYLEIQGLCFRLVPYMTPRINKEMSYRILTEKFRFGNAGQPGVYFDEVNRGHLTSIRNTYAQLCNYMIREAKAMTMQSPGSDTARRDSTKNMEMVKKLLTIVDKGISEQNVPYGMSSGHGNNHNAASVELMDAAYQCGMIQFAEKIRKQVTKDINQQLNYYQSIGDHYMTMDELISNLNLVTKNMESEFNNQQISFIQDMITCLRLQNTIEEIEKSRTDNRKP